MADGSVAVDSRGRQKQVVHISKIVKKYNWARHSEEISPLLVHSVSSILGAVVVVEQRLTRESWLRKKYMGLWRWGSELTAKMMSRFPSTVTRYRDRKSPKRRDCSSGSSEKPRRRNSETRV